MIYKSKIWCPATKMLAGVDRMHMSHLLALKDITLMFILELPLIQGYLSKG